MSGAIETSICNDAPNKGEAVHILALLLYFRARFLFTIYLDYFLQSNKYFVSFYCLKNYSNDEVKQL